MKIAVATDGKGRLTDLVALHFGRAKSFLIYDSEKGNFNIYPNPELSGKELPPDFLAREKVEVVIVFSLGPMAYEKFEKHQIRMFKAAKGTIRENLQKFKDNELRTLTKEDIF